MHLEGVEGNEVKILLAGCGSGSSARVPRILHPIRSSVLVAVRSVGKSQLCILHVWGYLSICSRHGSYRLCF